VYISGQAQLGSKWKPLLCGVRQWFLFVLLSGTFPFSELAPLSAHGFDLRIEAVVSDGLVRMGRPTEVTKRWIIQCGAQEASI
jgi:hypothetical protein